MIKRTLKNSRVRRMLDFINPISENEGDTNQTSPITDDGTNPIMNLKDCDKNEKQMHKLSDILENDKEDRVEDETENLVGTPCSISSFGGDSARIDALMNNNQSPSTISNLSLILNGHIDFVASPSIIYKTNDYYESSKEIIKKPKLVTFNETLCIELVPTSPVVLKPSNNEEFQTVYSIQTDETLERTKNIENEIRKQTEKFNEIKQIDEKILQTQQKMVTEPISYVNGVHSQDGTGETEHVIIIEEIDIQHQSAGMNLSRKRSRNESEWKDNKNKKMKDSGKSYTNKRTKKEYPAKTMGPVCSCKKNCSGKFTEEQREIIFKNFYKMADHELQWQFISRHTIAKPIKKMTIDRKQNRTQTINYSFPLNKSEITVCKVYFLNTLKISEQFVYTALEKIKKDEGLIDQRGSHTNRPQKMSNITKQSIMDHINIFPTVESHYIRKDSRRQYLSEQLNISKMYRLYELWFPQQNFSKDQKATKRQYETVFNTEFNYSFFRPKKDQCATCSLYEQADEERKRSLEDAYRKHIQKKETVRNIKNEEKLRADEKNTTIAAFDLEKVLSVPQSEVGIFHYKRKYAVYNFTVFDLIRKAGHCFVWHMSIAKRGSTEIGSCLLKFILEEQSRGIENFSFYSDGCAGQNKNRYIFALYLFAIQVHGVKNITHRFFETGHSQNEGDNMHSCIEKAMKNKILYTPEQVYSIISNAKISHPRYKIKEMEQVDFYDIKNLINGKNWLNDTQGRKIQWSKLMEVRVSHLKPTILQYKYDFDNDPFELDTKLPINKPKRGRKPVSGQVDEQTLKNVYSHPLPISKALFADLKSLCDSEAIPKCYHSFYSNLNYADIDIIPEEQQEDLDDN